MNAQRSDIHDVWPELGCGSVVWADSGKMYCGDTDDDDGLYLCPQCAKALAKEIDISRYIFRLQEEGVLGPIPIKEVNHEREEE